MAPQEENKFAIHEAAREGRLQTVESLLAVNPRLAILADDDTRLPIHWATAHNHLDIIRLLSSQTKPAFDADVQDSSGWTPLMIASSLKDNAGLETVTLLLDQKEADPKMTTTSGATALHFAVSKQNLEVVRKLLGNGASARVKDKRGQLPLHRAAAGGSLPIVKLLVGPEGRSPVNATDVDGMTALHHAVCEGNGDVAVELLRQGCDAEKEDGEGRTAIQLAPDAKVRSYIVKAAEREGIDL